MTPNSVADFIREIYRTNEFIALHEPSFNGNELSYVTEAIESTYVSSVGKFVDDFEKKIEIYTGTSKATATVNGTAALHAALHVAGVNAGEVVITQALTFVATCNVLHHMGVTPAFVDVSKNTMGLCPASVRNILRRECGYKRKSSVSKKISKKDRGCGSNAHFWASSRAR